MSLSSVWHVNFNKWLLCDANDCLHLYLSLYLDKSGYQSSVTGTDKHKYGYELKENNHFHHTNTGKVSRQILITLTLFFVDRKILLDPFSTASAQKIFKFFNIKLFFAIENFMILLLTVYSFTFFIISSFRARLNLQQGVRLGCFGFEIDGRKYYTQYVADSKGLYDEFKNKLYKEF